MIGHATVPHKPDPAWAEVDAFKSTERSPDVVEWEKFFREYMARHPSPRGTRRDDQRAFIPIDEDSPSPDSRLFYTCGCAQWTFELSAIRADLDTSQRKRSLDPSMP